MYCQSKVSKADISQNFMAFSEYMNFNWKILYIPRMIEQGTFHKSLREILFQKLA